MTKPQIATILEAWARKKERANSINLAADRKLQPHLDVYEKKTAAIIAERDGKLLDLVPEMEKLELQVRNALLALVTAEGLAPAPIDIGVATAQVTVDRKREIDPAAFMRAVPPAMRREPLYMQCFSVLVGKVEKFLDAATLARIVRPKLTPSVAITLKSE